MTTKMTGAVRKDGGWALIGTQEASDDASLTQTGLSSVYDTYVVGLSNMVPVATSANSYLRLGDSSGVDSGASDYVGLWQGFREGSTTADIQDEGAQTYIRLGSTAGSDSEEGRSFMMWILNPGDAGVRNTVYGYAIGYSSDPKMRGEYIYGMRESVITLDRVNFLFSSGNIASGRMTVWGISHE